MIDHGCLLVLGAFNHLISRGLGNRLSLLVGLRFRVVGSGCIGNILRIARFAVDVALLALIRIGSIIAACLFLDVAVICPFDGIAKPLHRLKRKVDDLVLDVADAGVIDRSYKSISCHSSHPPLGTDDHPLRPTGACELSGRYKLPRLMTRQF
jgi:energy-converting hydrogenase Eha subunit C